MSGQSSVRFAQIHRILKSESGMTLVEVMVCLGLFIIIMTLTGVCFFSGQRHVRDVQANIGLQEKGRLFVTDFEYDVKGATAVRVGDSGKTLVLRCADGEAIAYEFDSKARTLFRQIRRAQNPPFVETRNPFPKDLSVRQCSFDIENGCAAVCVTLCSRKKLKSTQPGDSATIQGRAAMLAAD